MTDKVSLDPQAIEKLSKEELLEKFLQTRQGVEDLQAQQSVLADVLLSKVEGSGEVVGHYTISVAQRVTFFPDITKPKEKLEKARELSAIKEAIDNAKLKKLWEQGAEIPHKVTKYPIVKEIVMAEEKV